MENIGTEDTESNRVQHVIKMVFIQCRFRRDKQHARRKKCIKTFNPNARQEDEDNIGVYPKMTLKIVLKIVCHGVAEFIRGTDVIVQLQELVSKVIKLLTLQKAKCS